MSEETCYQEHTDVILKTEKDFFENNKERLRKQAKIKTENYLIKKKI